MSFCRYPSPFSFDRYSRLLDNIDKHENGLLSFSLAYKRFGLNKVEGGIQLREWLPAARSVALMGEFSKSPTLPPSLSLLLYSLLLSYCILSYFLTGTPHFLSSDFFLSACLIITREKHSYAYIYVYMYICIYMYVMDRMRMKN